MTLLTYILYKKKKFRIWPTSKNVEILMEKEGVNIEKRRTSSHPGTTLNLNYRYFRISFSRDPHSMDIHSFKSHIRDPSLIENHSKLSMVNRVELR